jgi:Tol biopolymer transport system component
MHATSFSPAPPARTSRRSWLAALASAVVALLVLGGLSAPAEATVERKVTLKATKATAGEPFTLSGKVTRSPKGTKVVVQRKKGKKWVKVARTTTKKKGKYSVELTVAKPGDVTYRAKVAKKLGNKKTLKAAVSKARKVTVAPKPKKQQEKLVEPPSRRLRLISKTSSGVSANGRSYVWSTRQGPSMSGDGRYTVFWSEATNLVSGDTNEANDVFLYDRYADSVSLVSRSRTGGPSNGSSNWPAISRDGRWVAYRSSATNIVAGAPDYGVYLWDRVTNATILVAAYENGSGGAPAVADGGNHVAFTNYNPVSGGSRWKNVFHWTRGGSIKTVSTTSSGTGYGNNPSDAPSISADGRYVAYESSATNIVAGDDNGRTDVFVWNRDSGTNTRVTTTGGLDAALSGDGRFIAYAQSVTGKGSQVYLQDRTTSTRTLVSRTVGGEPGTGSSRHPHVSWDGSYIAFESLAPDLAPDGNLHEINGTDVFVWRRSNNEVRMVSRTVPDGPASTFNEMGRVSDDGRFVAFGSAAKLLAADTNEHADVYFWDRTGAL